MTVLGVFCKKSVSGDNAVLKSGHPIRVEVQKGGAGLGAVEVKGRAGPDEWMGRSRQMNAPTDGMDYSSTRPHQQQGAN